MQISDHKKQEISQQMTLKAIELGLSDNKAAQVIGISNGYFSCIKNGKWDPIAEATWLKVLSWVSLRFGWQAAKTKTLVRIHGICNHAKKDSIALAICDEPGSGKSFSLKQFAEKNAGTVYVEAQEYFTKTVFLAHIGNALGLKLAGSVADMMDDVIQGLMNSKALLIIDEMDKLKDPCLNIWKSIYNRLEGICGFVICGAPNLKKKLMQGAKKDKQCYKEIVSRIGSEFIPVVSATTEDKIAICEANGLNKELTAQVLQESNGSDLRALKRIIEKIKIANNE